MRTKETQFLDRRRVAGEAGAYVGHQDSAREDPMNSLSLPARDKTGGWQGWKNLGSGSTCLDQCQDCDRRMSLGRDVKSLEGGRRRVSEYRWDGDTGLTKKVWKNTEW